MISEGETRKLSHTPDMLYGLSDRLAMLALERPEIYSNAYTSAINIIEKEENPGMRNRYNGKSTQADIILSLLKRGARVTRMGLSVHHKIATPTARITELRQKGHNIQTRQKICPINGSAYVEYFLNEPELRTA